MVMAMTREAIVDAVKLPVTVKKDWDGMIKQKIFLEVAERLWDIGIKALTVHERTRSQMYKGSAD